MEWRTWRSQQSPFPSICTNALHCLHLNGVLFVAEVAGQNSQRPRTPDLHFTGVCGDDASVEIVLNLNPRLFLVRFSIGLGAIGAAAPASASDAASGSSSREAVHSDTNTSLN